MDKWYVRANVGVYLTQNPIGVRLYGNYFAIGTEGDVATFSSQEAAEEVARKATEADADRAGATWEATTQPPGWLKD